MTIQSGCSPRAWQNASSVVTRVSTVTGAVAHPVPQVRANGRLVNLGEMDPVTRVDPKPLAPVDRLPNPSAITGPSEPPLVGGAYGGDEPAVAPEAVRKSLRATANDAHG